MKKEVVDNINSLCASPTLHLERFQKLKKWTGPSVYFHEKTLERLKKLGSPLDAVRDRQYQEYLYATLCAWGLHRMGGEAGRLVEFDKFCQRLESLRPGLHRLQRLHLDELASQEDIDTTRDSLWNLIESMRLRPVNKPYLVVASKALHHLLPDLVVPIDGRHTVKFFLWPNDWRKKQREMFFEIFPCLVDMAKRIKPEVGAYIGQPFHRSLPKVIDNAIVGLIDQSKSARAEKNPASGNTKFSQPSKTSFGGSKTMDADRIRQKALELYFETARQQGRKEVVIISGKLHREVGLRNRYRNVCQALAGGNLQQMANAELLKQEGPKDSSTTHFIYRLL